MGEATTISQSIRNAMAAPSSGQVPQQRTNRLFQAVFSGSIRTSTSQDKDAQLTLTVSTNDQVSAQQMTPSAVPVMHLPGETTQPDDNSDDKVDQEQAGGQTPTTGMAQMLSVIGLPIAVLPLPVLTGGISADGLALPSSAAGKTQEMPEITSSSTEPSAMNMTADNTSESALGSTGQLPGVPTMSLTATISGEPVAGALLPQSELSSATVKIPFGNEQTTATLSQESATAPLALNMPSGVLGMGLLLGKALQQALTNRMGTSGEGASPVIVPQTFSLTAPDGQISSAVPSTLSSSGTGGVQDLSGLSGTSEMSISALLGMEAGKSQAVLSEDNAGVDLSHDIGSTGRVAVRDAGQGPSPVGRQALPHVAIQGISFKEQAMLPQSEKHAPEEQPSSNTDLAFSTMMMVDQPRTSASTVVSGGLQVSARQVIEQVVASAHAHLKADGQEIIVRLDPPDLGLLRLEVSHHSSGEMIAKISATSTVAHELLEARLPELRQALADAGIHVGQCSVSLDMQARHGEQQHRNSWGEQANHPAMPRADTIPAQIAEQHITDRFRGSSNRAVDYFA